MLILVLTMFTLIAVVSAAAYVQLQWTISATVSANPKASFWNWSGSSKANNFTYSVNIFPNIVTIDENITYGIFNDDASTRDCYMRIYSLTTSSNINSINVTVHNVTGNLWTKEWSSFGSLPTSWEGPFTLIANAKYSIWLEINATDSASGTSTFVMEMKELNP